MNDLVRLASNKGFTSNIIGKSRESKYSNKDFYYLWMCELQIWLEKTFNCMIGIRFYSGNISMTKKFEWLYEIDYYGKDFEILLTNTSDKLETGFNSRKDAMEEGLLEALKLIK